MSIFLARIGFVAAMIGTLTVATEASSQTVKKDAVQKASLGSEQVELKRSVFSGNEARVSIFWGAMADCSSVPVDFRVVKAPANGEVTFREVRTAIEFRKSHARARCNGKPVSGVGMFYTSRDDFSGRERFTVDVDYGGDIRRISATVDVR
jgi:hypothetical protein